MKFKALKALVGDYGRLNKGDEIDLPPHIANQLLAFGYIIVRDQPTRRKGKKHG